ncbi:MAG: ATP-dependent DNA ligase [Candidatus Manganitrophus sp. SA1]|nr:ATP-dependent DNA ligase [Candidatus Manganitrophus morganii]
MKFLNLVHDFEKLEATSKRLEMFSILSDLFQRANAEEIDKIIYLAQGELLPPFHGINIGMSEKYLLRALAKAGDVDLEMIAKQYRIVGDLGGLAEKVIHGEGKRLTVAEVYERIDAIAAMSGEGSVERKIDAVCELIGAVSPLEAKYVARFMAGKLRLGAGDATILEALALSKGDRAYRKELDRAYNITSDLGLVAKTLYQAGEEGIRAMSVRMGYPIRPALCERLSSAEEIVEKIGRCSVEVKYDGLRCQIHKSKNDLAIFSRNQERTTPMFPEIAEACRNLFGEQEIIIEGEALAFNEATGDLLPFQITSQRKRKHGIEDMAKAFPLKFFVFDLLYLNGEDYTHHGYAQRRKKLFELIKKNPVMEVSHAIETEDPVEIQKFFDASIERGLEGIVAKRLDGPYAAGSRNFNWIKLKRSYKGELSDSVDLVIVGYFAGKGHRAKFGIGTILSAVYDPGEDRFKTVTRIGTGFSEEELVQLKQLLDEEAAPERPHPVDSEITPDVWVNPKYVITVTADEITRSPNHTAGRDADGIGYALRFPRVQGFIRTDKSPQDATTVSEIIDMFNLQKRVKME